MDRYFERGTAAKKAGAAAKTLLIGWLAATNGLSFVNGAVSAFSFMPEEGLVTAEEYSKLSRTQKVVMTGVALPFGVLAAGLAADPSNCTGTPHAAVARGIENHAGRGAAAAFIVNQALFGAAGTGAAGFIAGAAAATAELASGGVAKNSGVGEIRCRL